jgi:hypothetical protein
MATRNRTAQNLPLLLAVGALALWWIARTKTAPTPMLPGPTVPSYYTPQQAGELYL